MVSRLYARAKFFSHNAMLFSYIFYFPATSRPGNKPSDSFFLALYVKIFTLMAEEEHG